MHLALVINRSAGSFRRLDLDDTVSAITRILQECGHQVTVAVVGRRDLADTLSTLAQDQRLDAVVVGGGDGTALTAVLAGLGRDKPMGLLPVGTLNLLARDLGLPLDPLAAAQAIGQGHVARIDLAEVNGLPFTIWASLGMHPWVVRQRDKLQKREGLGKWPAFALAAMRAFRRYPLMQVSLIADGKTTTVRTPLVVISNNAWRRQPLPLTREALDGGELVINVARATGRLGMLWLAFNALTGLWRAGSFLDTFRAEEVRVIGRKRRMMVSLDGEVTVLRSPLVFRLRPKTLQVMMPGPSSQDDRAV